jgi:hypothetical protein
LQIGALGLARPGQAGLIRTRAKKAGGQAPGNAAHLVHVGAVLQQQLDGGRAGGGRGQQQRRHLAP